LGTAETILTVVSALGGSAVIAAAVAAFFGKLFADRSLESHKADLGQETERLKGELAKESETHKLKLKKQELLFQKELEAASDFFALRRKIEPKYRHPDMDWGEALEDVVEAFAKSEDRLQSFAAKYGPVLSEDNRKDLDLATGIASDHKFASAGVGYRDLESAMKIAEKFLNVLQDIEDRFATELRS
jgi:hypothetical protein